MTTASVITAGVRGLVGVPADVTVTVEPGLPSYTYFDGPSGSSYEQHVRLRAALPNSGFRWPTGRIECKVTPSKDSSGATTHSDVAVALAMLVASGQLTQEAVEGIWFIGELDLGGEIRPVRGALPVAQAAVAHAARGLVVPAGNWEEARLAGGALQGYFTLSELVDRLGKGLAFPSRKPPQRVISADFSEIPGHVGPKRALEVAAAGGHHIILTGPPGAGKTMLARRVPGILPVLTDEQYREVTAIHSVAGILPVGVAPVRTAPFRAPHHTISLGGLLGGGPGPRPGEVSLAHEGVLLLDDLLELPRYVMDALAQVLRDRHIVIARGSGIVTYPARFMLVGGALPCPCGFRHEPWRCRCSPEEVKRYSGRLGKGFTDRIDMRVTVPAITLSSASTTPAESSAAIGARVDGARALQELRYSVPFAAQSNATVGLDWLRATMSTGAIDRLSALDVQDRPRAMRVARTIADLAQQNTVEADHIAEAAQWVR